MPRVKVLNYLKKVALFFRFERDILADGAQVIGRDAEKRAREKAASIKKMFLQSFIVLISILFVVNDNSFYSILQSFLYRQDCRILIVLPHLSVPSACRCRGL